MKRDGGTLSGTIARRTALVAALLGSYGCGPADAVDESDLLGETAEAAGPTSITRWDQLTAMVSNGNYRLDASLDANGKSWTPISFNGTFDGNNKTISNLTVNVAGDAGFFVSLNGATVKNLRLTNLRVTGSWTAGGLAGVAQDTTLDRISVEGTITTNNGWSSGGILGYMVGGTITHSYAKGTVNGSLYYASGGLTGTLFQSETKRGEIYESYAQVTVSPDTSDASRIIYAGGISGSTFAADVHDVYAVGNVTGRGGVGGLLGYLNADEFNPWMLYKGIYRGDVVDKNAPTGGWAGTVGLVVDYNARFTMLHYDRWLDQSSNRYPGSWQQGDTTTELKSPTTPIGGVFCAPDVVPGRCGDNTFFDPPWNAGTKDQHHTLRNMPGPNAQPTQ